MRIEVIHPCELDAELLGRWSRLQQARPELQSPFFRPEYVQALDLVRRDVRVGIMRHEGRIVGFFPFQRILPGIGEPAGAPLSDYEGPIVAGGVPWKLSDLLRGCRLAGLRFNNVPASQAAFAGHGVRTIPAPVMELAADFRMGADERRKLRKLEREVGPVRFVGHEPDGRRLATLRRLKSEGYARKGAVDLFKRQWIAELVERIHATDAGCGFGGIFSVLYADDALVAAHLGMRSGNVWHWWFPCYDARFARYSPGLLLLMMMAEHGLGLGMTELHFGEGYDPFKHRLKTREIPVVSGGIGWLPPDLPRPRRGPVRLIKDLLLQTSVGPRLQRWYTGWGNAPPSATFGPSAPRQGGTSGKASPSLPPAARLPSG